MRTYFEKPVGADVGIRIVNLVKWYPGAPQPSLKKVNAKIYDKGITVLLGHNGAGKTTLMSIMTGMIAPTSGTIYIYGIDITKDKAAARDMIAFCPQYDTIFELLTVFEHLKLFGILRGLRGHKLEKSVRKVIQVFAFEPYLNTYAKNLSGGWKRRLCIGMAFVINTPVIILDEPTTGMDPEARRGVWDALLTLRGQYLILLSTHYMEGKMMKKKKKSLAQSFL